MWYKHGGRSNYLLAYEKVDAVTKQLHVDFLLSLKDYYLDREKTAFFVHAGFTNMNGVAYEFLRIILLG
jgi:serine/threonine protein phosphatase 1